MGASLRGTHRQGGKEFSRMGHPKPTPQQARLGDVGYSLAMAETQRSSYQCMKGGEIIEESSVP